MTSLIYVYVYTLHWSAKEVADREHSCSSLKLFAFPSAWLQIESLKWNRIIIQLILIVLFPEFLNNGWKSRVTAGKRLQ